MIGALFAFAASVAVGHSASFEFTRLSGDAAKPGYISRGIGLVLDGAGNLYVAEYSCVKKITPAGAISVLAGDPENNGYADGLGGAARFFGLGGITVDAAGNLFVTDGSNQMVRKITPAGAVTSVAGSAIQVGSADGVGSAARFSWPQGIVADPQGFLYVADSSNGTIRKISPDGTVTTFAGAADHLSDSVDGVGVAARFLYPGALTRDARGNLYVSDRGGRSVRKITPEGMVTTLAGSQGGIVDGLGDLAGFDGVGGMVADKEGNLYVTENARNLVRKITPLGLVTTIAGQLGGGELVDGVGGYAHFFSPRGLAIDSNGILLVADSGNKIVRKGVPTPTPGPPIFLDSAWAAATNLLIGSNKSLTAAVASATPVRFQWLKDGVALPGETSDTLTLSNISKADEGTYSIAATNDGGQQTLPFATLTIYSPPVRSFTTVHSVAGGSFLWGVTSGGPSIVAVGTRGTILTSGDGTNWTRGNSNTDAWLLGVTWGNNQYVAVGDQGTILVSSDGASWTRAAQSDTTQRLNNVVYGSGLFVAVGEAGTVVTSTDGFNWTARNSGVSGWLRGLVCMPEWGNGDDGTPGSSITGDLPKFRAAGQDGSVIGSKDGMVWFPLGRFFNPPEDIEVMATNGTIVYAVGAKGSVSFDNAFFPASWFPPSVPIESNNRIRGFALGAGAIFATGEHGTVVVAPSTYGPWTPAATNTEANLVAGTFQNNSLYVIGENETILRSTPLFNSRLLNISTRAYAGSEAGTMISGFVVTGDTPKQVLLRAIGPGLSRLAGLSGTASTPRLKLFDAKGAEIANNADWRAAPNKSDIVATAARVGAFPLNEADNDSALLATLKPGAYTAHVDVSTGQAGLALVEAYDADQISNGGSKMINISTRAMAGTGANTIIAGFVVGGDAARKVLIRAIGPALRTRFGLSGVLEHPILTIHNAAGDVLQQSGAWSSSANVDEVADAARRAGAFALDQGSNDAAVVTTLVPGIYTVSANGANNESGLALIEVYDLP